MKRIAVIGTGLMGRGIIHTCALQHISIDVYGHSTDYQSHLLSYFKHELNKNRITKEQFETCLGNLSYYFIKSDLSNISQADLIIETIKEDKQLKKKLFKKLNNYTTDESIIATNTSTFALSEFTSQLKRPDKFIGLHFISPVPIISAVEVIVGLKTSKETLQQIQKFCRKIRKEPFVVKDHPGFVFNRVFLLWVNEAVTLLEENLTDGPDVIDSLIQKGMSLKMGPLKLIDLVGVDIVYHSLQSLYEHLQEPKYKPSSLLAEMFDKGHLGRKTGRGFYYY